MTEERRKQLDAFFEMELKLTEEEKWYLFDKEKAYRDRISYESLLKRTEQEAYEKAFQEAYEKTLNETRSEKSQKNKDK